MSVDTSPAAAQGLVLPFLIDVGERKAALRGRLARVDEVASSILSRHDYPSAVAELSAESMALAACLATTMDYDGVFTLQASGNGDVKTLFADVTSSGAMRAYAQHDEELDPATPLGAPAPLIGLMGTGYLAFTVDQGEQGRYQGIVPIEDADLTGVAMRYFADSEQIDTALLIAALPKISGPITSGPKKSQPTDAGGWHAAALMLQRIPETGGTNDAPIISAEEDDIWHTACTLMATCTRDELVDPELAPADLLRRLFHELDVSVLPLREITDECRCSPDRVDRMLAGLSKDERLEFADDDGMITVACEFCKKEHRSAA
ncbi:MAG: Hsp33 family molecular chaperone HslO [Alphaproteobacteria bacterium]|nr:Hsp33 family molecular chaperone HslO [Alphaproteobacteria bacterium]